MVRKSIQERLAQLEAQKKTLQARLSTQERARDTRRKVLLGALLLHRIDGGDPAMAAQLRAWIQRELPGFLTRDTDKVLFEELFDLKAADRTGVNAFSSKSPASAAE